MFLCADLWKEAKTLRAAYHDSLGVTEEFIKNGIQHALRSLGHGPAGDAALWDYDVSLRTHSTDSFGTPSPDPACMQDVHAFLASAGLCLSMCI